MNTLIFALTFLVAVSARAQLPTTSPKAAGFDPARLEVLHATTRRFVDEGKHAGILTLRARDGKIVDFRAYGYRDVEKQLPMERDTIFVEHKPIVETWPEPGRGIEAGGAGILSTAGDYARFAKMLCNGGTLDGQRVLGRKTIELMTANHMVTLPNNQAATRQKGFGFGVEVTTDLGQLSVPSSLGQFGWYGAATTYCQIDPTERIVAISLAQHFPFNEHNFFAQFQTGYYQALK